MKYGFIGLGKMATSIINGMLKAEVASPCEIFGCDVDESRREALKNEFGINVFAQAEKVCNSADCIVLAIKPQVMDSFLSELKPHISGKLIVSIAAGKTLEYLSSMLRDDAAIVRVMPNLCAMTLSATSAYTANSNATEENKATVRKLMSAVGSVTEIPESMFSAFTAVASSSPAFVFLYIDMLAKSAIENGFSDKDALNIALSTVYGTAKTALESGIHPAKLCENVCSPGGTTIEGIKSLKNDGFDTAVLTAIGAVMKRDAELGRKA